MDGWFRTEQLGHWNSDRTLTILGERLGVLEPFHGVLLRYAGTYVHACSWSSTCVLVSALYLLESALIVWPVRRHLSTYTRRASSYNRYAFSAAASRELWWQSSCRIRRHFTAGPLRTCLAFRTAPPTCAFPA